MYLDLIYQVLKINFRHYFSCIAIFLLYQFINNEIEILNDLNK